MPATNVHVCSYHGQCMQEAQHSASAAPPPRAAAAAREKRPPAHKTQEKKEILGGNARGRGTAKHNKPISAHGTDQSVLSAS